MIINHDQFEAALEKALATFAQPPVAESKEHQEFMALLKDIAEYRPAVLASSGKNARSDKLAARLTRFEAAIAPVYGEHWSGMVGGDLRRH